MVVWIQKNGRSDGRPCSEGDGNCDDHGLGNTVVLRHPLDGEVVYTLYAHLEKFDREFKVDIDEVKAGEPIGTMGGSGFGLSNKWGVHLHFEVRSCPVVPNLGCNGNNWGYAPDLPNKYGYHDPILDLHTVQSISPTPIEMVGLPEINLRGRPQAGGVSLGKITRNRKLVAINKVRQDDNNEVWYQVFLPVPVTNGIPRGWILGWIAGRHRDCVDNECSREVPSETQAEVVGTGSLINIRTAPSDDPSTILAKGWEGQHFVLAPGTPMPAGSGCSQEWQPISLPNFPGVLSGWACGEFLRLSGSTVPPPPSQGIWSPTGSLTTARYWHAATLLPNGKVRVVGGYGNSGILTSAEEYDPAANGGNGNWGPPTDGLPTARLYHTATVLSDGKVLVVGGYTNTSTGNAIASAELFDPAANGGVGAWRATGSLTTARVWHTATLLLNGKVLVVGGSTGTNSGSPLASAELWDPAANNGKGAWTPTLQPLTTAQVWHTATLLLNGKVLVAGGAI
jgi:murein DD-endopeptidase MepM/ murein hydrolase activator NlpD